jgi:hypothetical protein
MSGAPLSARQLDIEPDQVYLALSTSGTETLQREVDIATSEGFRIVATTSRGSGQVVLMRRTAEAGTDFSYRVLGTTRVDTMEKELNEIAEDGYCLIPGMTLARDRIFGPPEIVAFMERAPGSSRRCEYRLLGTSRTGTMEQELVTVEALGFELIDVTQANELTAVLERERLPANTDGPERTEETEAAEN